MKIKTTIFLIALTFLVSGCFNNSQTNELGVFIDTSGDPAYTVFSSHGDEFDTSSLDIELIPISEFENEKAKYFKANALINDYSEIEVENGIINLLKTYPQTQFGYTFNGGIAFTYNDYQYAINLYDEYMKDPDNYSPLNDQAADPIHPLNHLEALLENY